MYVSTLSRNVSAVYTTKDPSAGIIDRSQPRDVPPEVKGRSFEGYVFDLFQRHHWCRVMHWRGDKLSARGAYAADSCDPDLEVRFTLQNTTHHLAVECKWRAAFRNGKVEVATERQLRQYSRYGRRHHQRVYLVLGIGGMPERPGELYVIPLECVSVQPMSMADLIRFRQKHTTGHFYYFPDKEGLILCSCRARTDLVTPGPVQHDPR